MFVEVCEARGDGLELLASRLWFRVGCWHSVDESGSGTVDLNVFWGYDAPAFEVNEGSSNALEFSRHGLTFSSEHANRESKRFLIVFNELAVFVEIDRLPQD